MAAIAVRGLCKAYGGLFGKRFEALTGVNLDIEEGMTFGLIGANGAGKTTSIKVLLGVVRVTAGEVKVLGAPPGDVQAHANIGYLPERLQLPGAWTATAFLQSVARLRRVEATVPAVRTVLERVGLGDHPDDRIGRFSKGMRQRLGLASALIGGPRLLILDEPTDGIDPMGRADVRRILSEERARGATIFLNSHLLSETERVCDRVAVLARGKVIREGSVEELCGHRGGWRARLVSANAEALRPLGITLQADGWWQVPADGPEELNRTLAEMARSGAMLVELRPWQDLESVLVEAVREVA